MRGIRVLYSKPFENFIAPHTTEYRYKKQKLLFGWFLKKENRFLISILPRMIDWSLDQSQKLNVGGDCKIDATNSVVNLRDIIGQFTNTIDQIPTSSKSEKSEIKELLTKLQTAVDDPKGSAMIK